MASAECRGESGPIRGCDAWPRFWGSPHFTTTAPPHWWSTAGSSPRPRRSDSPGSSTTRRFRPRRSATACGRRDSRRSDLDYVAFYDKPLTKFERLLETYLAYAPAGFRSFRLAMPLWLKDKLHMRRTLRNGLDGPTPRPADLHRPSREPRRQRLLPVPLRPGGDRDPGRGRRVEHGRLRRRRGQSHPPDRPHRVSPLAGPALFGVHLLLRLQGQQRRIQADGPGPLRAADLPGPDPRAPGRPQARRQLLARHGLFQLLPGADDDRPAVPPPVRRPAAHPRGPPGAAAHGPGRQHPGRDRGGRAPDRPARGAGRPG